MNAGMERIPYSQRERDEMTKCQMRKRTLMVSEPTWRLLRDAVLDFARSFFAF